MQRCFLLTSQKKLKAKKFQENIDEINQEDWEFVEKFYQEFPALRAQFDFFTDSLFKDSNFRETLKTIKELILIVDHINNGD